jgi:ADP-dependent NAD(P)H-hydrate dehydratase / NAD(P)H-hydrate epimerase
MLKHDTPIYRTQEIRTLEARAMAAPDKPQLMERAGLAAAELARELAADSGKRVVIFAGPGNNGGDAFVLARHLKCWWFNVFVSFSGERAKLPPDAAAAFEAWHEAGGETRAELPSPGACGLVVDGLFGIGLQRDVAGGYAERIAWINAAGAHAPVLALDLPSGLESDSGRVLGCAVRATHTITFIAMKPGLATLEGPEHCGAIDVATLDVDARALLEPTGHVIGREAIAIALPPRRLNTHKGDYGSVGVIGGASGMAGAAVLAGRAALKLGAGRVYVGFESREVPAFDPVQPELMFRRADDVLAMDHMTCLAVGPGLGQTDEAKALLHAALTRRLPLVLDADALNLIAADETLAHALAGRSAPAVLTPHPAEAARLLHTTTAEVQHDRLDAATRLAISLRANVVLKGAGSVCTRPDARWAINTSGNPGMASAGMGDVLTGIIAALLAQGAAADDALEAAVYLHGAAADALVERGCGPVGLVAGELIDAAREIVANSTRTHAR